MSPEYWTRVTEFVLLGFPSSHILLSLLFLGLMVTYIVMAPDNLLIVGLSWVE